MLGMLVHLYHIYVTFKGHGHRVKKCSFLLMAARYEVTNFTDVRGDVIYFWLFVVIFYTIQ